TSPWKRPARPRRRSRGRRAPAAVPRTRAPVPAEASKPTRPENRLHLEGCGWASWTPAGGTPGLLSEETGRGCGPMNRACEAMLIAPLPALVKQSAWRLNDFKLLQERSGFQLAQDAIGAPRQQASRQIGPQRRGVRPRARDGFVDHLGRIGTPDQPGDRQPAVGQR